MQGIWVLSFIAENAGGEKGFLVLTFGLIWGPPEADKYFVA